jgi:hypothetical protein
VPCRKLYYAEYYSKNMDGHKSSAKKLKIILKKYIQDYKENNPCEDCGEYYRYWVMDFDHRESSHKRKGISRLVNNGSMRKLKEEMDKCDLVCSNCHRSRGAARIGLI